MATSATTYAYTFSHARDKKISYDIFTNAARTNTF